MSYLCCMATPAMRDIDRLIEEIHKEAEESGPQAVEYLAKLTAELTIAATVLKLRLQQGLSPKELAEMTGVDEEEISRIETGKANPTLETLTALASPFGLTVGFVDPT
jgi:DNA-binding XRE family transcriptional regulator